MVFRKGDIHLHTAHHSQSAYFCNAASHFQFSDTSSSSRNQYCLLLTEYTLFVKSIRRQNAHPRNQHNK